MNVTTTFDGFLRSVATGRTEIYNEFSLQHELGIFLRNALPNSKVQFERNISFFGFSRSDFTKREIDISVFNKSERQIAVELKFPRSGQHPEQMFSFCKDIAFLEELQHAGFAKCLFLAVVDDHLFYKGATEGIYAYFRGATPLTGTIDKPTGRRDTSVTLNGRYTVRWEPLGRDMKYALIDVQASA